MTRDGWKEREREGSAEGNVSVASPKAEDYATPELAAKASKRAPNSNAV